MGEKTMQIGATPEQKRELEAWPKFGMLQNLTIGAAPHLGRINIYLAGEDGKKAMFQVDEERARGLIQNLSEAVDNISVGPQ